MHSLVCVLLFPGRMWWHSKKYSPDVTVPLFGEPSIEETILSYLCWSYTFYFFQYKKRPFKSNQNYVIQCKKKPTITPVRPAKTQVSLYIHPVWLVFIFRGAGLRNAELYVNKFMKISRLSEVGLTVFFILKSNVLQQMSRIREVL